MTARIVLHQTILVAVTILSEYRMKKKKKKKKKKNAYWNLKQSQGTCRRKGYPIKNTRNFFGHDFKRPKDEDLPVWRHVCKLSMTESNKAVRTGGRYCVAVAPNNRSCQNRSYTPGGKMHQFSIWTAS